MLELFRKLPIDQILRSSHQARKDFEHQGLISLSESLRQEGLQNPVTVRLTIGPRSRLGKSSENHKVTFQKRLVF